MSDKTGIEWTDASWNPVTGCTKVSQGCKHCYAERTWNRLSANPKAKKYFDREFTDVACHPDVLDQPLRWTRPRKVFVNSMSDLFHDAVPDVFIDQVFATMGTVFCKMEDPHVFQILTKRPERMWAYLSDPRVKYRVTKAMKAMGMNLPGENTVPVWPLPNVWIGVSVEDQQTARTRIPALLATPAAVRWLSMEPLLGPVDLIEVDYSDGMMVDTFPCIDWVVVGGESGPKARPMHPQWVRSLRDQCRQFRVPFLFKQWGQWAPISEMPEGLQDVLYRSNRIARRGEDQAVVDEIYGRSCTVDSGVLGIDGTLLDVVEPGAFDAKRYPMTAFSVGKTRAGRVLDGRTWDEYPEVA